MESRNIETGENSTVMTGDRAKNFQNMSGGNMTVYNYTADRQDEYVENEEELNEKIRVYMNKLYKNQEPVHVLYYGNSTVPFKEIYVCNRIKYDVPRNENAVQRDEYTEYGEYLKDEDSDKNKIKDATIMDLIKFSNYIIISGTGGLGKSMIMKHILFDIIEKYNSYELFPIFLELKDYKKVSSLTKYIHKKINEFFSESKGAGISFQSLVKLLEKGKCVILLDGLDELKSIFRDNFEENLETMIQRYGDNKYVIASRPYSYLGIYQRFHMLQLCPFNQDEAVALVGKLEYRKENPSIKKVFKHRLQTDLYITHRSFIRNPLLLTIMLLTYEMFAEVPNQMHLFYKYAYQALSITHDANKGYKREMYTGLSAERFEKYFAEFCARSYMNEDYRFTDEEFDFYFDKLKERKVEHEKGKDVTAEQFKLDLTRSICMMNYEEYEYHFIHRSFQEYFCAVYFARQDDAQLGRIGKALESKGFHHGALVMLYNIKPKQVEKYIFLPELKKILGDSKGQDGYFSFLRIMCPSIEYSLETSTHILDVEFGNLPFILSCICEVKNLVIETSGECPLPPIPGFEKDNVFFAKESGTLIIIVVTHFYMKYHQMTLNI